ncbi:MAG: VCBS repeat-containing protein [Bernardetiaceae bacterium]|nr:VCBS repeat-containing protein [Bernardetiaceae bacterium]
MMPLRFCLLLLLIVAWTEARAQVPAYTFYDSVPVRASNQPLANAWAGGFNSPQFSTIDLDGDRRPDLFVFDRTANQVFTFINTGQGYRAAPEYAALFPPELSDWCLLADYDGDGRKDLFSRGNLGVRAFRNETPPNGRLAFRLLKNPLEVRSLLNNFVLNLQIDATDVPALADVDNDGDLDILNFVPASGNSLEWNRNVSRERFGHSDSLVFERSTNRWGNFDECARCNEFRFGPSFCRTERLEHAGSTTLALDLNGDNLKDLLIGDVSCNNLIALTNQGTTREANFTGFNPAYPPSRPVDIPVFPAPYWEDVDFDGVNDLLVSPNAAANDGLQINFAQSVWFYKNVGTNARPDFQFRQTDFLQNQMVDVGENSRPALLDVDADGDLDLLLASGGWRPNLNEPYRSRLYLFQNVGTAARPSFNLLETNYLNWLDQNVRFLKIGVADLNADRADDLYFTFTTNGNPARPTLAYVPNQAGPGQPSRFDLAQLTTLSLETLNTNDEALFLNTDTDGDLDLLLAKSNGAVQWWENTGRLQFTQRSDQAGGLSADPARTGPSLATTDLDRNGQPDLVVADRSGRLQTYLNFLPQLGGRFNSPSPLVFNGLTSQAMPSPLGYLVGGGAPAFYGRDLVLGTPGGGLRYLRPRELVTGLPTEIPLSPQALCAPPPRAGCK